MGKRLLKVLIILSLIYPAKINNPRGDQDAGQCKICIMQREGYLPFILRRALHAESAPSESESFGHCFSCVQCKGDLNSSCWGWWPAQPGGGDYQGDEGRLHPDGKEKWEKAACRSINEEEAEAFMAYLSDYEKNNRYHVLNRDGRSCLGFCEDMAHAAKLEPHLPWGDLTITGEMEFPMAPIQLTNPMKASAGRLMKDLLSNPWPPREGNMWKPSGEK